METHTSMHVHMHRHIHSHSLQHEPQTHLSSLRQALPIQGVSLLLRPIGLAGRKRHAKKPHRLKHAWAWGHRGAPQKKTLLWIWSSAPNVMLGTFFPN